MWGVRHPGTFGSSLRVTYTPMDEPSPLEQIAGLNEHCAAWANDYEAQRKRIVKAQTELKACRERTAGLEDEVCFFSSVDTNLPKRHDRWQHDPSNPDASSSAGECRFCVLFACHDSARQELAAAIEAMAAEIAPKDTDLWGVWFPGEFGDSYALHCHSEETARFVAAAKADRRVVRLRVIEVDQ